MMIVVMNVVKKVPLMKKKMLSQEHGNKGVSANGTI